MKFFRDGIYNYIPVTPIEELILSNPAVLRLHRVLQNSTVFNTFPFNRGSRYPHSVGAMHIAGKLCESIYANSDDRVLNAIFAGITKFLTGLPPRTITSANKYLEELHKSPTTKNRDLGDSFYRRQAWIVDNKTQESPFLDKDLKLIDINFLKSIIFQGIRLAALVHDIGHPPYSHVIEHSLTNIMVLAEAPTDIYKETSKLNSQYKDVLQKHLENFFGESAAVLKTKIAPLHERIGLVLISQILVRDPGKPLPEDERNYFEISLSIAILLICIEQLGSKEDKIFKSASRSNPFLKTLFPLASLISGPVDSDRLDYLVRDSLNFGAPDFNSFDQDRIVNGVVILEEAKKKNQGTQSQTATEENLALSLISAFDRRTTFALSDFFQTRMRQYKWLIGHHNVVRTDIALSRLIMILIAVLQDIRSPENGFDFNETDRLKIFLNKYEFSKIYGFENLLKTYRYLDDSWLDSVLQSILEEYNTLIYNRQNLSQVEQTVVNYLRVLYERKTELMRTIWKNEDDFMPFCEGFHAGISEIRPTKFKHLKAQTISEAIKATRRQSPSLGGFNQIILEFLRYKKTDNPYFALVGIEEQLNREGSGYKIAFSFKDFKPYQPVTLLQKDLKQVDLQDLSSTVSRLKSIYTEGLNFYAFDLKQKINWKPNEIYSLGKAFADAFVTHTISKFS